MNETGDFEVAVDPEKKAKEPKPTGLQVFYEWFEVFVVAAVIVVLIFTFVGRMATVRGTSMSNTLAHNDRLIVLNAFYTPKRYDIVVVQKEEGYFSDELLVKRIIATGGETITFDFENWTVAVDGVKLPETYVKREYGSMDREDIVGNTITVPEGYVFVMGDNRNGSTDSRSDLVGFVKESEIVGRAVFRLFPFSSIGSLTGKPSFNH